MLRGWMVGGPFLDNFLLYRGSCFLYGGSQNCTTILVFYFWWEGDYQFGYVRSVDLLFEGRFGWVGVFVGGVAVVHFEVLVIYTYRGIFFVFRGVFCIQVVQIPFGGIFMVN